VISGGQKRQDCLCGQATHREYATTTVNPLSGLRRPSTLSPNPDRQPNVSWVQRSGTQHPNRSFSIGIQVPLVQKNGNPLSAEDPIDPRDLSGSLSSEFLKFHHIFNFDITANQIIVITQYNSSGIYFNN
jgi:hypothetical protein